MSTWPTEKDVPKFFGEVGKNQVTIPLPFPMKLAWDLKTQTKRITLHTKVAESATRAFNAILKEYGPDKIDELGLNVLGGSFNVRKMRGGNRWSMHSWGIAIDFDPSNNQLKWGKDKARFARPEYLPFWAIWESEGWVSLGRQRNYDWMHVQAARL